MRSFVLGGMLWESTWHVQRCGRQLSVFCDETGETQVVTREFPDESAAVDTEERLIRDRLARGYVEVEPREVGVSPQAALENFVIEDPENAAAHQAYADWLCERGDPRGEFIQVQLAAERIDQPPSKRSELIDRARQLLELHGLTWLGPAAFLLAEVEAGNLLGDFWRGWLVRAGIGRLTNEKAAALAAAPQTRLVQSLVIAALDWNPREERTSPLATLLTSPHLGNLRWFCLDKCHRARPGDLVDLVVDAWTLPRLEELELRSLEEGDAFCETLVESGILKRLRTLQLVGCGITDEGVRLLAGCRDTARLGWLSLDHNPIRPSALEGLRAKGVACRAEAILDEHVPDPPPGWRYPQRALYDDEEWEFDEWEPHRD